MRLTDLDYDLPAGLIATRPAEPRDAARMMVVRLKSPGITHTHVSHLPALLQRGDLLVSNDTTVCPARLVAERIDTGGRVEGLFLSGTKQTWVVMLKSNGRLRPGQRLRLFTPEGSPSIHVLSLVERNGANWQAWLESSDTAHQVLDQVGLTPIPPYIRRARGDDVIPDSADRGWYQTTFAAPSKNESIAAPTAGLHLTPGLLDQLGGEGVGHCSVTLQVGAGTFKPVTVAEVEQHPIHEEWFSIPLATLESIQSARRCGGRVVAVGTTTVRALETVDLAGWHVAKSNGDLAVDGRTDLLITPPYSPRWFDGLLTNFHLPRSTLLALIAAIVGLDRLQELYSLAIAEEYRFYSYGDCMLILP